MRRFTVSLPDDLYESLRRHCDQAVPPTTLQQMVRFAVEGSLGQAPGTDDAKETPDTSSGTVPRGNVEPVDLLVFTIRDTLYGLPIDAVETVAAHTAVHAVPSTSATLIGVAGFRGSLIEVHDGGLLLTEEPLDRTLEPTLLAVSTDDGPVLITVSTVTGLVHADVLRWDAAPASAPPWVTALAWDDNRVITVANPRETLDL